MISKTLHSSDGTALHTVHGPAVGETKAHVVLCHGANEHVGRYGHVIESLNQAGFAVTGLDLRGHGKSGGKRCHVLRWEHYSEDIRVVIQSVGGPVFVLGHSMGGLVVLEAIRSGINGTEIKGVMTSNPLLGLAFTPPRVKEAFAKLLSTVVPGLLMGNEVNPNHLSHDQAMNEAYMADPLVSKKLSPRWYTEMLSAVQRVHDAAGNFETPLLLMQGTADPVTSAPIASEFFQRYGGPKTLQAHEGLYHEVFNEIEREKVIADMIGWLNDQTDSQ